MYTLSEIKAVHVEMTERCNLSCLMCDRNQNGGDVNPYLKNRELTFEDMKRTFDIDFIKQLNRVYFCGNYGEPILANGLMPTLKYLRENNENIKLSVITNGCLRSTQWWHDLAKVTNSVRFSIDGLEDTHKIYRQGAIWSSLIRNAKAYIDSGGYAIWDYLVFGHNEHQVEQARQLSKDLGFAEFVVKKTGRFFSNVKLKGKDEHAGIKKPKSKDNINKSLKKEDIIIKKYGSIENYLDKTPVDCKVLRNKEMYISAEGIVLPCCWLAGQMYKWYLPKKSTQIWEVIGNKNLNINNRNLKDIFESGIFKKIQNSWSKTLLEGKIKTCALKCGMELDQFGDQYK